MPRLRHRAITRPIILKNGPPPPIGQIVTPIGMHVVYKAARLRRRLLARSIIETFTPRNLAGFLLKPFLPRVPHPLRETSEDLLAKFTEILSATYNSLSGQGYLRQTGPKTYVIIGGGVAEPRDPGVFDDYLAGCNKGNVWVNTATDAFWVCVDNTVGAAVWVNNSSSSTTIDGGTWP